MNYEWRNRPGGRHLLRAYPEGQTVATQIAVVAIHARKYEVYTDTNFDCAKGEYLTWRRSFAAAKSVLEDSEYSWPRIPRLRSWAPTPDAPEEVPATPIVVPIIATPEAPKPVPEVKVETPNTEEQDNALILQAALLRADRKAEIAHKEYLLDYLYNEVANLEQEIEDLEAELEEEDE